MRIWDRSPSVRKVSEEDPGLWLCDWDWAWELQDLLLQGVTSTPKKSRCVSLLRDLSVNQDEKRKNFRIRFELLETIIWRDSEWFYLTKINLKRWRYWKIQGKNKWYPLLKEIILYYRKDLGKRIRSVPVDTIGNLCPLKARYDSRVLTHHGMSPFSVAELTERVSGELV